MSSHNAYPREGHLETVLHMMGYLKVKHNSRLAMDPNYPKIDEESFKPQDWSQQYGDIKEAIPINAPTPRGKEVVLRMMGIASLMSPYCWDQSRGLKLSSSISG